MVEANNRDYSNPWYVKYKQHLKDARRRGIVSNLEYEDYVQKVNGAGITEPEQIGKHRGQFVLGRFTDEGPYTKDSCRFIPSEENLKEAFANGRHDEWIASRQGMNKENSEWMRKISETLTGRTKETHAGPAAVSAALSGRTKETHEYLARQSARQLGQTKETSEMYRKVSEAKTGRTKETHAGLAAAAEKMRGRTKENHAGVAARAAAMRGRSKETHEHIARTAEKLRGRTAESHEYIAERARKTGLAHSGRTAQTHEYVKNRTEKLSRSFVLYSPTGEVFAGKNVRAFADDHGLDPSTLAKVLGGKQPATHGWRGRYTSKSVQIDRARGGFIIDVTNALSAIWVPLSPEVGSGFLDEVIESVFESIQSTENARASLERLAQEYPHLGAEWQAGLVRFGLALMNTLLCLKLYNQDKCLNGLGYVFRNTKSSFVVAYFVDSEK